MSHDVLDMIEYRDQASILLFADTERALGRARDAAEAADLRVSGAAPTAEAPERLARQPSDAMLVDLAECGDAGGTAALLGRMAAEADRGRAGVVLAPPAMIDLVAAVAWHPGILHLCDPGPADLVAALALAGRRPEMRLHDASRQGSAVLHQLSEEVGRIASILANLSEDEMEGAPPAGAIADAADDEPAIDAPTLRALIRARRMRDQYFRSDLFADPAWDMLLDLMAARLEQGRVAVSSLCIAAAVPATTALRWIKGLTDRGVFVRHADPRDGRRVYIELADDAARALNAYFRAIQRIAPSVI
jgi:hypothetical protein